MSLLENADKALKAKEYSNALEMYQLAQKEDPNNPVVYQGLAYSFYNLKQFDDAIKNCQKALELDPNLASAHIVLAYIHLRRKELGTSKQEALEAFRLAPNSFDVLICYGTVLLTNNEADKAIELLQKAIERKPDAWLPHKNLALAYLKKQQMTPYLREKSIVARLQPSIKNRVELLLAYLLAYRTLVIILLTGLFAISLYFPSKHLEIFPYAVVTMGFALSLFLLYQRQWKRGLPLFLVSLGLYIFLYFGMKFK